MNPNRSLQDFLNHNRIENSTWEKSNISWDTLKAIAADHESQFEHLRVSAELLASVIQRFPNVHSVRWRIKDSEHLLEKIIRKRADSAEKYASIDSTNYFKIVTDLVGLRALHLFKDDCFLIDQRLRSVWQPVETPIAYIRQGDPNDLVNRFSQLGFDVQEHHAGYRSIHYICATQPMQRTVFAEVQVRTIFEEGWSEIDHRVRYPNFSDDRLVSYFLTIFNRLAGSADEMGTFVQGLISALGDFNETLDRANQEKEEALSEMDKVLSELESLKKQDSDAKSKIATLQKEVEKLRRLSSVGDVLTTTNRNALTSLIGFDSRLHGVSSDNFGNVKNPFSGSQPLWPGIGDGLRITASKTDDTNRLSDFLKINKNK